MAAILGNQTAWTLVEGLNRIDIVGVTGSSPVTRIGTVLDTIPTPLGLAVNPPALSIRRDDLPGRHGSRNSERIPTMPDARPWYRKSRSMWVLTFNGRQIPLGIGDPLGHQRPGRRREHTSRRRWEIRPQW